MRQPAVLAVLVSLISGTACVDDECDSEDSCTDDTALFETAYDEGLGATMNVWKGAAVKIVEECRSAGAEVAHLSSLLALMDASIADGAGSKELGVLFEQMIRPGR